MASLRSINVRAGVIHLKVDRKEFQNSESSCGFPVRDNRKFLGKNQSRKFKKTSSFSRRCYCNASEEKLSPSKDTPTGCITENRIVSNFDDSASNRLQNSQATNFHSTLTPNNLQGNNVEIFPLHAQSFVEEDRVSVTAEKIIVPRLESHISPIRDEITGGNSFVSEISLPNDIAISKIGSKSVETAWEALVRWSRSWRTSKKSKDFDILANTSKVAVLGGGSFGTAMAVMLARNKPSMDVVLLVRRSDVCDSINQQHINKKYFPKHILPENVRATTDPNEALIDAQYCIHAVPVQSSGAFLHEVAKYIPKSLPIISVSKGLEVSSLEMMSQLIPRSLSNPKQPIVVVSGPSFSIELMDRLPTALVAASKDASLARATQQLLASSYLRVNTSSDVVGVEMAGALKNVLAIAAGIVEGMKLGNNCMAALVAQGCAEIRWLVEKMGGNPATLAGLSGAGDIMLTCFVNLSRNRSVGVRLGAGEKIEDIISSMDQVAEGVATAAAVIALARKYRVQMPVLTAVARILENELTPKKAVLELMTLPQVEER